VLYSHACSLQEALLASQEAAEMAAAVALASGASSGVQRTSSLGVGSAVAAVAGGGRAASERAIQATFAHAAQYIVLAYAMQPGGCCCHRCALFAGLGQQQGG